MSKNLERVIQRAISDAAFRRQLQSNPDAALRGLNLTQAEVAALRSGDASKLTSLGIDQRMSKTFTFGGDSLASRASIGGDLTSGAGMSLTDRDVRMNSAVSDSSAGSVNSAVDSETASGATRVIPTDASGSAPAFDPGVAGTTRSVGDPLSESGTASVIADPDNPAHARGYTGQAASTSDAMEDQSHAFAATRSADVAAAGQAAPIEGSPEEFAFRDQGATASTLADPDNPAAARGYIGGQAASASDAIEDQSHGFAATRSADVGGSNVGYSANYPAHGGLAGQSADSAASARGSVIGDPDNPASARTFTGGQAASASDAIEDQGHAFAATRSADVAGAGQAAPIEGSPEEFAFRDQGATASSLSDPDNPAAARGYIGGQTAPTSDAIEDQSHAIAASRSDAFLSEGEVSQYSDPSLNTGQAVDEGQLFTPNAGETLPDDAGTVSVRHEPDIPS